MAERGRPSEQLGEILKQKLSRWIIVTVDPLLLIVHLTLIYIVALVADDLVVEVIERAFQELIAASSFAAALLRGIKIFSALGVALAYGLHMIYQLYLQARHVVKTTKETEEMGER
jgi:hypothetical protein